MINKSYVQYMKGLNKLTPLSIFAFYGNNAANLYKKFKNLTSFVEKRTFLTLMYTCNVILIFFSLSVTIPVESVWLKEFFLKIIFNF